MRQVMANFRVYSAVEVALLLVGLVLLWRARRGGFAWGLGGGLVPQAALMLALDHLAELRGAEYLAYLLSLG